MVLLSISIFYKILGELTPMKKNGVVYTPENIVNLLLKEVDYNGKKILKKHVMENSCGDGAFLIKIVEKYVKNFYLQTQT